MGNNTTEPNPSSGSTLGDDSKRVPLWWAPPGSSARPIQPPNDDWMTGADHVPDDWAPVQVKPLWATRLQDIARGLEENQVPILSGSVTTLANRVDGIESLIATMQTNLANNPANQDVTELRGNFSKLSNELAEIKAVDLTKIRQATETITGNSAFFVEAIATQGKIEALRAIVDALNLRVKDLEEQRERKRSQREWLINAAIAVLGIVIGAAGALLTK